MRPLHVALLSTALVAFAAQARAQSPKERADALFEQGLADMIAGKYETGCPAIADSYDIDPTPGTRFTLAECEAKWGHNARALGLYEAFVAEAEALPPADKAKQAQRVAVSKRQIQALSPKVGRLTVELAPNAPSGTDAEVDGEMLERAELGTAQPVEPGTRRVVVRAPGHEPREYSEQVAAGESKTLQVEPGPETADSGEEEEEEADRGKKLFAEIALGVGPVISFEGLGVGPFVFLEGGVAYRLGPGTLAGGLRMAFEYFPTSKEGDLPCPSTGACVAADGGHYSYDLTEQALSFGIPIAYRFLPPDEVGTPYIGVVPTLYLLKATSNAFDSENTQTGTQFGIQGHIGGQIKAGPGGVFLEAGVQWAGLSHSITGDASLAAFTAALGYRAVL